MSDRLRVLSWVVGVIGLAGCPASHDSEGAGGAAGGVAGAGGQSLTGVGGAAGGVIDVAGDAALMLPIAERLPPGWSGTGVLAARRDLPTGAPAWAGVVAEVVDENGQRLLRATGEARGIKNPMLARTAAGNRARAELAYWLGTQQLVGSEVIANWGFPGGKVFAQAQVAVPADWRPGAAPADAAPAAETKTEQP